MTYTTSTRADLKQSLESLPANARKVSSQSKIPDIDKIGICGTALVNAYSVLTDYADTSDTEQAYDMLAPDSGHPPHVFPNNTNGGNGVEDSGTMPFLSIFGGPPDNAPHDTSDFVLTCSSAMICDTEQFTGNLARGDTLMEGEKCDFHYTSTSSYATDSAETSPKADVEIVCLPDDDDDGDAASAEDDEHDCHDLDCTAEISGFNEQSFTTRMLRPPAPSTRGFTSTWMDQDDSGDYNPKADRQRLKVKRARENSSGRKRNKVLGKLPVSNADKEQNHRCSATTKKRGAKSRRPSDCVECSRSRLDCSYEDGGGASRECNRTGRTCTIADKGSLRSSGTGPVKSTEHGARTSEVARAGDRVFLCDSGNHNSVPGGMVRTITTSFSHPMVFNCDDQEPRKPCHFCIQPALRFIGFGRKKTSIIDFDDSSGFVELADGHREDLVEPTRLCVECTTAGLSIIMCEAHTMTPIPGLEVVNQALIFNRMLDERLEDGDLELFCSLCSGLASVECNTAQEDSHDGCGLKLCDRCSAVLVGQYDGDVGAMLVQAGDRTTQEPGTAFRADAELLMSEGVLMRYLACLSKQ